MRVFLFMVMCAVHSLSGHAQEDKPLLQFGNFEGYGPRDATIEQILEYPWFKCTQKGCKVTGFEIWGIVPAKEAIGPYASESDTMTESQIRYVRSLVHDSKLWINRIHVKCKDGTEQIVGNKGADYSIYFFNIK